MVLDKENPIITPLQIGAEYKVLKITGKKGMLVPSHISTKEAVVIIQEGKATLKIQGKEHLLTKTDLFIVPGGISHSLIIHEELTAIVLMAIDSEIVFAEP